MKQSSRFAPTSRTSTATTYSKTVLGNGVRILTEEIPHVRSVSVGLWIDTGSRDETPESNGLAHVVEHMLFKGTTNRSVKEIARSIESVGGYLNAFTGKEQTCYYARVLDEHTQLAFDVLSDMVCHATFPEAEFEKEKGVIIEEMRNAQDDPDDIIFDEFDKAVFGHHPLGRPVIGTEQNVRRFTRQDLEHFRSDRFRGDTLVVAAAGNLRHEDVVRFGEEFLGSLPPSGRARGRRRPRPVRGTAVRTTKPILQAHLCLGRQAFGVRHNQRYPLLVLNTLLGDGMSSRLFQSVREQKGIAYSVFSFVNMMTDAGSFGVYAGLDRKNIGRTVDLVWAELERLTRRSVGKAELRRTKDQLKGSMMLSLESIPNRMMRLGSAELTLGELPSLDAIIRSIEQVTADDIRAVAADLFRREAFSTVLFEPDASGAVSAEPV